MLYKDIIFDELKHLSTNTILIDVREPHEVKFGHLKNAQLLPLSEINLDKVQDLCDSLNKQNKLDLSQKINLVFYCRSGVRSIKAINKVFEDCEEDNNNFNIFNLKNGIISCII